MRHCHFWKALCPSTANSELFQKQLKELVDGKLQELHGCDAFTFRRSETRSRVLQHLSDLC